MKNFNLVSYMKAGRLQSEKVIINTHGETADQIDNTGGHQAYLDYLATLEAEKQNEVKNERL